MALVSMNDISKQAKSLDSTASNTFTAFTEQPEAITESIAIDLPTDQATTMATTMPMIAAATPAPNAIESKWADYSPEPVELPFPELPPPDYKCYQPPQVPPGQTRYLKVDEPATVKTLEQNFNDVRTAIRENNTHVQRNKTQVTNISRNHNHLLRIVTNENNYEHNLTNKIVKVADIHRQKIENVPGETRNFKDFKQTQKVENLGCRRADVAIVSAPAVAAAPAVSKVATPAPPIVPVRPVAASLVSAPPASLVSARPVYSQARAYPSGYSLAAPASAYAASLAAPASAYAASYASPYQVIAPEQRNPAVFI